MLLLLPPVTQLITQLGSLLRVACKCSPAGRRRVLQCLGYISPAIFWAFYGDKRAEQKAVIP